jgi:hypothetical protein
MKIRINNPIFLLFLVASFSFAETYTNRFLYRNKLLTLRNRTYQKWRNQRICPGSKDDLGNPCTGKLYSKITKQ